MFKGGPRFGAPNTQMVEMYEGVSHPEKPYNERLVSALTGKLLLIHNMRSHFPTEMTLQLADALQKQQKEFDMFLEVSGEHAVTSNGLHRTWDYLVKNLLQLEPPTSIQVKSINESLAPVVNRYLAQHPQYDFPGHPE